ncbi:MAG: OmpA family protein [Alphaproteobacteria bacterium]|nr:OmpA family protein [Alphaproteobacteria bacterium]
MMLRAVMMATAALSLTACGANYDVMGARSLPNRGEDFHRALQTDYADLAASEKSEADWADTKEFVARARRAATGETFLPEALNNRAIPGHAAKSIGDARARLIAVLNDGTRPSMPVMAAMAQSGFDCWMQEQEEDRQPEDIAACRSSFNTALRALEAAKPAPVAQAAPASSMPDQFQIYFDFDSANLNADAQAVVTQISEAHEKYNPATVLVIGHTDSAGSSDYNIMLSQSRAETVYNALAEEGIDQSEMRVEAYGEERPRTSKPDGTREQDNRRVDVIFEK